MDDASDDNAILDRIRQHLRRDVPGAVAAAPRPASMPTADDFDLDVAALSEAKDIYALSLRSHRRGLGPALALANRTLRKLLKPTLERQVSYNAANERVLRVLLQEIAALKASQAALTARCDALTAQLTAMQDAQKRG